MKKMHTVYRFLTVALAVAGVCCCLWGPMGCSGAGGGAAGGDNYKFAYYHSTGTLEGWVYDSTAKDSSHSRMLVPDGYAPVAGVVVTANTTNNTATTDSNGYFKLTDVMSDAPSYLNFTYNNTLALSLTVNSVPANTTTKVTSEGWDVVCLTTVSASDIIALFIGINDYPASPLNYCVADAQGMRDNLRYSNLWSNATIQELYNADATKANIQARIAEVAGQIKSGAMFFMFYSGHGSNDGSTTYIVPVDGSDTASFISATEMQSYLTPISAKGATMCIAFDSCYSGGFIGKSRADRTARYMPIAGSDPKFKGDSFERQLETISNLVFLSASRGSQLSWETSTFGHGVFTNYLMEGLGTGSGTGPADVNQDGSISATDLYNYASPFVIQWAQSVGEEQDPQIQNNYAGELVIKQ